jgi:hypothetical protein
MSGVTDPLVIEPDPDDGVGMVRAGLAAWLIALVVALVRRETLADRGARWWVWTCVAGLVTGGMMLIFMMRRSRIYREHRARTEAAVVSD